MSDLINKDDFTNLYSALIPTALQAGQAIMEIYNAPIDVEYKSDESPVTLADKTAEKIILETLKDIAPDIPVIAEESVTEGIIPDTGRYFWLVDPLDGTKEFIKKGTDFTVNIALIEDKKPIFGIIYAPARAELFYSASTSQTIKAKVDSHSKILEQKTITAQPTHDTPIAVASKSHRDATTDKFLQEQNITSIESSGSSLKFCLVAEGTADIYPRFAPTMEWDTAAGHAILLSAGGSVINPDGSDFSYQKKDYYNGHFIALSKSYKLNL